MTRNTDPLQATKDLFSKHPNKEYAFKWEGRLDDTLVLLNGEKAIPIPIEHTVRENTNVAEAIVFGSGKPQLGLFVIPAVKAENMERVEFLEQIMPSVESANADQPAYARISREMIRILPSNLKYPRTDKDTVIRAAFYKQFREDIEKVYDDSLLEGSSSEDLNLDQLQDFLRRTIIDVMKLEDESLLSDDVDFFALGMDSLQALRIHSAIIKGFNTNGKRVGQNVVFEHPSLTNLTAHLNSLRTGEVYVKESPQQTMARLLSKYSTFNPHAPGTADTSKTALLTGATGSLGAHVLAQLAQDPQIDTI